MKDRIFITLAVVAMMALSAFKAGKTSLTHDEALAFDLFGNEPVTDIISNKPVFSPSNHYLNSIFVRWSTLAFGKGEFAIRLPNVLAHGMFVLFSLLILRLVVKRKLILCGSIMLLFNPYLLDFFSLARGYGLAASFMMGSLYFFARYLDSGKLKFYYLALLFSGLAVWSNISLFSFMLALILSYQVILLVEKRSVKIWIKGNIGTVIFLVLMGLGLWPVFNQLRTLDLNLNAGLNGFWRDTVIFLMYNSVHLASDFWILFFKIIVIGSIFLFAASWIYLFIQHKIHAVIENKFLFAFNSIIVLTVILQVLFHAIFGTPYLKQRFALFLIPLFYLNFVVILDALGKIYSLRIIVPVFSYIVAIMLVIQTLTTFSFHSYYDWQFDADNRQMLSKLDIDRRAKGKDKIILGVGPEHEPSIKYSQKHRNFKWIDEIRVIGKDEYWQCDYFYVSESRKSFKIRFPADTVAVFETDRSYLIRMKNKPVGLLRYP